MQAIIGARVEHGRLTSHVGAESSEQCFDGESRMSFAISDVVTGRNTARLAVAHGSIFAGGALRVEQRILPTLSLKCFA